MSDKIYGPYIGKDKRSRIIISHDDGTKTRQSYPRFLMEKHLNRKLLSTEDIHHKDHDVTNNTIDNLEIIDHVQHCTQHAQKYIKYTKDIIVTCLFCGKQFTLTLKQQRTHNSNLSRKIPKLGPFCSRTCSGKYGKQKQMSS